MLKANITTSLPPACIWHYIHFRYTNLEEFSPAILSRVESVLYWTTSQPKHTLSPVYTHVCQPHCSCVSPVFVTESQQSGRGADSVRQSIRTEAGAVMPPSACGGAVGSPLLTVCLRCRKRTGRPCISPAAWNRPMKNQCNRHVMTTRHSPLKRPFTHN